MKRINFYLSDPQLAALRVLTQHTGLSMAELLRRAIDAYIQQWYREHEAPPPRETRER
jgi:hypothetical protein